MLSLIFIFWISTLAGFVDAIAGGGGLILMPALLFVGIPVQSAVATNKLYNVTSSLTSALRFQRSKTISWSHFSWMVIPAIMGAICGTRLIGRLSHQIAEPVIASLLILVALIVFFRKDFLQNEVGGGSQSPKSIPIRDGIKIGGMGFIIGIHDGFFGPGAGIFLIFSLIHFGKVSFLRATSTAKVVNLMTSLFALISFILIGNINWHYGVVGSLGVSIGAYFGASHAGHKGTKLIRPIFLCMALAIAVKLFL